MLTGKKKILFSFLGIVASILLNKSLVAQSTISAIKIQCIAVDSTGTSATVTWAIPSDTNNTFISYQINNSTTGAGYTVGAPVTPDNVSSTVITGINANATPIYFFGQTNTTNGDAVGDTVKSINLSVSGTNIALLQWNAMHKPNLPGFNGWYKIYWAYSPAYKWNLLDSTQSLSYSDTITVCKDSIRFKIIADNTLAGCQSVSNVVSGEFTNSTPPNPTFMDTVSVAGNNVNISWFPSSSMDVAGYLIYEYINGTVQVIDTVVGRNSTFFNCTTSNPDGGSVSFYVAPYDSCGNLCQYSTPQKTIYLQNTPDKCAQTNTLNWTPFIDLISGVGKYNIYESVNGGKFTLLASTDSTTYVQTGLNKIQTLCYYVQVVSKGNPKVTASSNIICYQTTLPPPPKFAYLQSATVINNSTQNQVNWYVDTNAGIDTFFVQRADSQTGFMTTVGKPLAASHKVFYSFTDPTANPNKQSYTYKVYCVDSCGAVTDSTNIGQTMFLTAVGNSTGQNNISWNDYVQWQKGVSTYTIYRNEDNGPFSPIITVAASGAGQNLYTDDVSSIITGQGVFGYYIKALEIQPSYPFIDTSISNIAYAYQDPRLYIPNAFNPNGVNKIFKPVGVFENLQNYDFSIFDRWGIQVFETTDVNQGWDGTYKGKKVEEDVYVYRIQYTSGKGEYFTQRGWVMMLK